MSADPAAVLASLVQALAPGGRLLRAWPLPGGISARTTAFEAARPDGALGAFVVRWPPGGEAAAAAEFRLLQALHAAGLAVPEPLLLDADGALGGGPCVVSALVDGAPDYAPQAPERRAAVLAAELARIHAAPVRSLPPLPRVTEALAHMLGAQGGSPLGARLRQALQDRPFGRRNRPVLLHGDFWPGNVLWKDGRLVAVVDWEDAALGDPLADLAVARLDLLWVFGPAAVEALTARYLALAPCDPSDLPLWDLFAALRAGAWLAEAAQGWPGLGRPDLTEGRMRERLGGFAEAAFRRLSCADAGPPIP